MAETARAAVLVEPGRYEIQEFPLPKLEDGALLMKVEMSGICGTDKHTYQGETKQYAGTAAEMSTPFPIIQGHENVGIVAEITPSAAKNIEFYGQELKVGDRIVHCPDIVCGKCYYCTHIHSFLWCEKMRSYGNSFSSAQWPHLVGGWAEYIYLRPDTFVYKVPDGLPPNVAVLTEVMTITTSMDKLKEFSSYAIEGFNSGDTVVVLGVGPIGLLHLIKARMMGAGTIIATDKSDYRLNMAKECGADYTLNVGETSSEDRIDFVRQLTHGRGADVVLEMANVPYAMIEGLEMLRRGGMLLEMGNFADTGDTTINPHRHVCGKNARIIGLTNHPVTGYGPAMLLMQKYGHIYPFDKIVTHQYALDDVDAAMQKSISPDSMKVAIVP